MTEELKLPEPTFWVAAPPRGGLVLTEVRPSAWAAHPVYTADQMRAAILAERERCAKACEEQSGWNMYDPGETAAAIIRGGQ